MPICPSCGKNINVNTANKKKVRGVWVHKLCPGKRAKKVIEKKRLAGAGGIH